VFALLFVFGFALRIAPSANAQSMEPDTSDLVARIFTERCLRCHGPKKQRGELRLDNKEGVLSVVEPRSPTESELLRRVSLHEDAEDAMPPDGARLKAEEIATLKRWIDEGAPTGAFERGAKNSARKEAQRRLLLEQVRRSSRARVVELDDSGTRLRVDFSLTQGKIEKRNLGALGHAGKEIVELSLAGRSIGDAEVEAFPLMLNLERLHMERTTISDAGMPRLVQRAPNVRYLNLHSTQITAKSCLALQRLARLERLVLFGTEIDEASVEAFQKAHPGVNVTGTASLSESPFGPASNNRGPRMVLAADASKQRIALLRENAIRHFDLVWEHPIQQIHDLQVLENGNILFQESWTRLVEIDPRTKDLVWSYDAQKFNRESPEERVEIHAFRQLRGGLTMIAESGPARILEVDRAGEIRITVPLTVENPHHHHDTRLVRKTPANTYLVAHEADGAVREYDSQGKLIWSFDVPLFERERAGGHGLEAWGNQVFAAERLTNGNTLIATGNGHSVLEVTPAKDVVWHLKQNDIEGVRLAWVTTLQELRNGNLVIGNCHAGPEQPQLIEITRDKKLVWQFRDFERFGNSLSNAWVIEDPLVQSGLPIQTGR